MTCIREHPASPYPASMAGRVLESGVGWEAIYPRATGQAYEAEIRVGLYATEQEAQVRITRHPHMCSACNGCTHCSAVLAINSMSMHWRCGGRRHGTHPRLLPPYSLSPAVLTTAILHLCASLPSLRSPPAEGGGPAAPEGCAAGRH